MTNLQQHLQKETEHLRLTDAEKSAMRMRLQAAMGVMPVAKAPTKSPYQWILAPRSFALAVVAFLLVVSTGTTYAAEGSLPGGVLYPVKTNVIEPLTVALAPTVAAKAEANATIATTRVQEAQTLAADGTLTPAVAAEISTNYNEHATAALALAADADAATAAATSTPAATVAVDASATSTPVVVATATTTVDTSAPADTATSSDDTDAVVPSIAVPTVATFSARITIAATAPTSSPTVSVAVSDTATSSSSEVTPSTDTLVQTLHASLSIQARILDRLNAEVRIHHTKTPQ